MKIKQTNAVLLLAVFAAFMIPVNLFAGTTGKIAGSVLDAETGEKLPGANVVISNTPMGAATDLDGKYYITNVPPGLYSVRISMMGYKIQSMENVRVSIDLTTTLNAKLVPTVLEAGEEVTIVAERPLVQKDMTASMSSVNATEIRALPVQEINDVLELQAGIVRDGNELHIKGGRAGEVAYWVDGVATTDLYSGDMGVTVENSAIQELQVISGTFNAEYGQAMSGIINIITKEGTRNYSGQIKAYAGDYVSNGDEFSVLKSVKAVQNAKTGVMTALGEKEYPLRKFNPTYNGELSLSGPVPMVSNKLTFFLNARYFTDEGHLYGRRWFTPQGNPGDSSLVPMNPYHRTSIQGKLTYNLSNNLKVNYNVFWNAWKSERSYNQNYKYNPDGVAQGLGGGTTHIFSINHVLSPKTFYELRVNRFYNEYKSYVYENPLATPDYLVWVYPDTATGTSGFQLDLNDPTDAAKFEEIKLARLPFTYFIDPNGPAGYVHPDSAATPASYSFSNVGMDMGHFNRSSAYWVGKFDLSSQLTQVNELKAGFELRLHELKMENFTIRPKMTADNSGEVVPFEPSIPDISTTYYERYNRKPREFSAYVQDKLELKDIIMNFGLRFDYFDANSMIPSDPSDPNIYDPMLKKNIYKNYEKPPSTWSQAEVDAYESSLIKYTPEERRAFMQKEVDAKMRVSPRLGIAYPITDQGVIHFSYGHFFQIPEFSYLYDDPDFKLNKSGGYTIMGNADLHPQKTVMYEIGLQQQITRDLGIDVTLFYRDVRDWVGSSPKIPTVIDGVLYYKYENKDYENVRGFTLKIEKRQSNNFSGRLDYTYQVVEGTYSNPTDAFNADQNQQEPRLALVPMGWDQRHTLNGSLIYQLKRWTVSLIGRYWSGRPYTPAFVKGEMVGSTALIGLRENSSRLPNQKSVDLYINHRFTVAGLDWNVFFNIYNLMDQRDEVNVYADTGTSEYTTNIDPKDISYDAKRIGTVQDFVNQPGWYTTPRQIQVGLAVNF
jgi:hypothetical protein